MTIPRLTTRQANAFTLSRQCLTPNTLSPVEMVRRIVAVQSQYPACVAQSVFTRTTGSSAAEVERMIDTDHSLVRTWCLRGTVHTLAAVDLPLMVGAYGQRRRERHRHTVTKYYGITADELTAMERGILKALKNGPVSRKELKATVPEYKCLKGAGYGIDVAGLAGEGKIVFAPLIKGDTAFVLRKDWLPDLEWEVPPVREAWAKLARRYFRAHGPASWQDFRHWAGVKVASLKTIQEDLEGELAEVTVKGWPDEQYLLKDDLDELLDGGHKIPAVKLLPKFDAITLGYDHKARWIQPVYFPEVYRIAAQVEAVVLVKGRMAATWRIKPGKVIQASVMPFESLSKSVIVQVQREFKKLAKFYGADGIDVDIKGCAVFQAVTR